MEEEENGPRGAVPKVLQNRGRFGNSEQQNNDNRSPVRDTSNNTRQMNLNEKSQNWREQNLRRGSHGSGRVGFRGRNRSEHSRDGDTSGSLNNMKTSEKYRSNSSLQCHSCRNNSDCEKCNHQPFHPQRNNLGFKRLEEFSKMASEELIMQLSSKKVDLDKLLQTDLSGDYLVLLVRIMAKICETNFHEIMCKILSAFCEKEFVDKLRIYVGSIALHSPYDKLRNKYLWNNTEKFLKELLIFCETVLVRLPTRACDVLPKLVTQCSITVNSLSKHQNVIVSPQIDKKLEDVELKLTLTIEEKERKKVHREKVEIELEPPNSFRDISIYPSLEEITNPEEPFIRPNIVDGAYVSVDHYLDIQFRLLREDFVAPLREGICDYIKQLKSHEKRKRLFNIRVYKNIKFLKPYLHQDHMCTLLRFGKKLQYQLENSKRLMYGSLVCFTRDNFASLMLGTIVSNDPELLRRSQLAVKLIDYEEDLEYGVEYTMVECSVYFEPYYQVLKALKKIDQRSFPFRKYILDLDCSNEFPKYLTSHPELDISDRDDDDNFSLIRFLKARRSELTFNILDLESWPTAKQLELDDSQYKAFQSALRQEFCVIQGPPGTGKTFIGLKVTEYLLKYQDAWCQGPILVICYTNHALDQFLEGITQFTNSIARVGGRSKNEKLALYNIKLLRCIYEKQMKSDTYWKKRRDLRVCIEAIGATQCELEKIDMADGVLRFKYFRTLDCKLWDSWFMKAHPNELMRWLFEDVKINKQDGYQVKQTPQCNNNKSEDLLEQYVLDNLSSEYILDDGYEYNLPSHYINLEYLMTLGRLESYIRRREEKLIRLSSEDAHMNSYFEICSLQEEIQTYASQYVYLRDRLNKFKMGHVLRRPKDVDYNNPFHLTSDERWGLYFAWLCEYKVNLQIKLMVQEGTYRTNYDLCEEYRQLLNYSVMKESNVIGMTTTGAAQYQQTLQALNCPIVIVEEAAEVLESHIVVALTKHCHHLILIGDHKQLRPTTAEYKLAKKFNLEISLFERMVKNGIHCEQLEVQHRMRPEIVNLIVPSIYPKLSNHSSVYTYPSVLGVTTNLFFTTHNEFEEQIEDSSSHVNIHEAKYVIQLARYLVLQGYAPQDITIITTYTGQMFELWKEKKNETMLKDVRITVVDNFQGEENKIILLSLVRSNVEANIGFLKTANRVCVALSRAREGFFMIGNMDNLVQNNSLWPKIKERLVEQGCFGTHLKLRCQLHPETITEVASAGDFSQVSEGGCSLICGFSMDCGHSCESPCHIVDRKHEQHKCKQPCTKSCLRSHPCPKFCYLDCGDCVAGVNYELPCGHNANVPCHLEPNLYECKVKVVVTLDCGHLNDKECCMATQQVPCQHPCEIRKACGHACQRKCHIHDDPDHLKDKCLKPCGLYKKGCSTETHSCPLACHEQCPPCKAEIQKNRRNCKHKVTIECNADPDVTPCTEKCSRLMSCGHACRLKCADPCGNCNVAVEKLIPECGHQMKFKCKDEPARRNCLQKCSLLLPCGHPCENLCMEPCSTMCNAWLKNPHQAACGHDFNIPCHQTSEVFAATSYDLLHFCRQPCNSILDCEHECSGTCGSCAQGRIHVSCKQQCGANLLCGHPCEIPCRVTCQQLCKRKCEFKCSHSKCNKVCGEPCVPCKENCTRGCKHNRCKKRCGEICNVQACAEPCTELLKCGHSCLGLCGDTCPDLCRECNPEHEAFEVFFGTEEEPEARFVLLKDCGHIVVDESMKGYLDSQTDTTESKEITMIVCPRCKTPITKTSRYSDYVKKVFNDIIQIKKKTFGVPKDNESKHLALMTHMEQLIPFYNSENTFLANVTKELLRSLQKGNKKKKFALNSYQLNSCEIKLTLLSNLYQIYLQQKTLAKNSLRAAIVKHFEYLLKSMYARQNDLSNQEIKEFNIEIQRFGRIMELYKIQDSGNTDTITDVEIKRLYEGICEQLFSIKPYDVKCDENIHSNLMKVAKAVQFTLTEEFKAQIVKAIGLNKGKWFKCPNGHYYAIGECGGVMQLAQCADCKVQIGGTNHELLRTNQHAGEFDTSAQPAWSAQAHVANYRLL